MITRRRLLIALPAALCAPATAAAYLLPTPHVLRKATARLAASRGLTVTLAGEARLDDKREVEVVEQWSFGPKLAVTVTATETAVPSPAGAPSLAPPLAPPAAPPAASPAPLPGLQARIVGADITGDPALLPRAPVRQLLDLLFAQADPSAVMQAIGARRDAQSLALAGDRVVMVLGAPPGDRRAAALWIDNDDYTIRRVRFATDIGDAELRLDEWHGPITRGRFPHRLTVTLAGRPVRRLTARSMP